MQNNLSLDLGWNKNIIYSCFVVVYIVNLFINKYVLSVLNFTYPTIFQGWQMLVASIIFYCLIKFGFLTLHDINRNHIKVLLPQMTGFVTGIYSASKALTVLPIPVFLAIHNLLPATESILNNLRSSTCIDSLLVIICCALVLISCVMIAITDATVHYWGYVWVLIHITCLGFQQLYAYFTRNTTVLSSSQKLYCCCLFSFVTLAPSSFFVGDAFDAPNFPALGQLHFYISCIVSGLCGIFLNLSIFHLTDEDINPNHLLLIGKVLACLLSVPVFGGHMTTYITMWVTVSMSTTVVSLVSQWPDEVIFHQEKNNLQKINTI